MSQFKAREWWSAVAGDSRDQFNPQSMCIADCENDGSGDKILVGSLNGYLRIYKPSSSGYKAEDSLLEKNLGQPVLQVVCGVFSNHSTELLIAVLHPRLLAVHKLVKSLPPATGDQQTEEETAGGVSYDLKLVYQHKLKHTAYNICCGAFGRAKDSADLICVQSLDGVITVFEHDVVSFACYLPEFLIPGPIAYCRQLDAIITASAARLVQCYRYEAIARAASGDASTMEQQSTKRVTPYWSVDLGEHIQDIIEVVEKPEKSQRLISGDEDDSGDSFLMALGERSLYCLEADGSIRFAKKLESPPCCFVPYGLSSTTAAGEDPSQRQATVNVLTLVAYHAHRSLAVLSNTRLAWAASLPTAAPIAMAVANFESDKGLRKGIIVTMEDGGRLSCLYLGTEPLEGPTQILSRRRHMENHKREDMTRLKKLIQAVERSEGSAEEVEKQVTTDLRLVVSTKMSKEVPTRELAGAMGDGDEDSPRDCAVLSLAMHAPDEGGVHDIAVTVRCDHPVAVDPPGIVVNQVVGGGSSELQFRFFIVNTSTISNASAAVMASYTSSTGYPNSVIQDVMLPLPLFAKPVAPEKDASHKITIDSNKPCVNLNELFQDVSRKDVEVAHNSTGFKLSCGSTVSVLSSRNSQRYRVQSGSFPALWLVLAELTSRLDKHFQEGGIRADDGEPLKLVVRQDLPLKQYYHLIDQHFSKRKALQECMAALEQRAVEFRMLQKRLLLRIKEKTPTSLGYLDMLLNRSYELINQLCGDEELLRLDLHRSSVDLSAGTKVILILLRLYLDLSPEETHILEAVLTPHIGEPTDPQGWEESTDLALLHMLRTSFAKSQRESDVSLDPDLPVPDSTIDLKKHLSLFIKRLYEKSHAAGSVPVTEPTSPAVESTATQGEQGHGQAQLPQLNVQDPVPKVASPQPRANEDAAATPTTAAGAGDLDSSPPYVDLEATGSEASSPPGFMSA